MRKFATLPVLADVVAGRVVFSNDMPVWLARFGDDVWLLIDPESPLFTGHTTSSIVWGDYVHGRGATLKHRSSLAKAKYDYCLSAEIVCDLKIAAVIHGYFPKLLKDARSTKSELDPKTVKARIEELAKFFSLVIQEARTRFGHSIARLDQIPFGLVKELIPKCPGRGAHLKRALKLISDPMVQRNLNAPLQWELLDITKSAIAWGEDKDEGGIPTLSDTQFLFLLDYGKRSIAQFKRVARIGIHDSECRGFQHPDDEQQLQTLNVALDAYYAERDVPEQRWSFQARYGVAADDIAGLIRDAHASAMMLILLFTGMRSSETKFLMCDSLKYQNGYWFVDSKVVKGRSKNIPISEGWLVVDITKDAYDILCWICRKTSNPYLFSSPVVGFSKSKKPYRGGALNQKFSRWVKRIDEKGLFVSWAFSIHQCRETLVFQLAKQEVGMPFLSMQLKHFHSQFNSMPNSVTAGYGQYRSQLMVSISNRIACARERALMDIYGAEAKFAGGGGAAHKARIDAFFAGLGLFGKGREDYIKVMARRGVELMPTSIGSCTKNFVTSTDDRPPPCYGDYQCDPDCQSHVITERCARVLVARKVHALVEAEKESEGDYKSIWLGLADKLDGHIKKLALEVAHG